MHFDNNSKSSNSRHDKIYDKGKKKGGFFGLLIKIFFALVILGLVLVGGLFLWARTTPQYAMGKWLISIHDKNPDEFEKYIDYDRIVDNVIQEGIESQVEAGEEPVEGVNELVEFLRPSLVSAAKEAVREQVEKGDFAKDSSLSTQDQGFLKYLAIPGSYSFNWEKVSDDEYQVNLDEEVDTTLTWSKIAGNWKITNVKNFEELVGEDQLNNSLEGSEESETTEGSLDQEIEANGFKFSILETQKGSEVETLAFFGDYRGITIKENEEWLAITLLVVNNSGEDTRLAVTSDEYILTVGETQVDTIELFGNSTNYNLLANDYLVDTIFFPVDKDASSVKLSFPPKAQESLFETTGRSSSVVFNIDNFSYESDQVLTPLSLETLNIPDTFSFDDIDIEVKKADLNAKSDNSFSTPQDGNKFVKVDLGITNNSNSSTFFSSQYELKGATGQYYPIDYISIDPDKSVNKKIEAGDTLTGSIAFQVPKDEDLFYLYFSDFGSDEGAKVFELK
jgi:hypothetical protein